MNQILNFGDTLDNFSLLGNTKCKTFNLNEESIANVLGSDDFMCSFNNTKKSSQTNISVDDSIFLKEFESSQQFICNESPQEHNCTGSSQHDRSNTKLVSTHQNTTPTDLSLEFVQNNESLKSVQFQEKLTEKSVYKFDKISKNNSSNGIIVAKSDTSIIENVTNSNDLLDNELCLISSWGLPREILQKYKERKINKMFNWQVQCLSNANVLKNNCNLIYSAPTSAGKTLVAEILAIKTVIERRKKVLFVLPFVSVVREKMFYFQDILGTSGIRVEGFMGAYSSPGGFQPVQVAVCTIEKANSLINRLLEEGNLADIGTVIIDEIHLLGDPNRGYLLELLLTKLLYMSSKDIHIQIIGMSATLPNLNLLGKWLKAEIYTTDFRPIPLYEQWLLDGCVYTKDLQLQRTIEALPELDTDVDNILYLCLETIQRSCSVLIFCPTKNWCENLSQQIALAFWKLGSSTSSFGITLRQELNTDMIRELLEQLKQCPSGLDNILQKTISFGVAFHHAGLTMDERDIIEAAFRKTTLRVLVATSTLSSGVNLPAKRVIIRTPLFHGKPLDSLVYRQMIGRAGRMGKDTSGESILICQKNNYEIGKELVSSKLNPIRSCLDLSGILTRAILEVVASGVVTTPTDVTTFSNCTLFAATYEDDESLCNPVTEAIEFLCSNEFIRLQEQEDGTSKYLPTPLGKACLSSSMSPEEGLSIFLELQQARQSFVLETDLHLIYIVTPYSTCNQWGNLDWMLYLDMWEKLPISMKKVGELVGVRESYIINATRNKITTNTSKMYRKLQIHKRFFTALALQDLVNEVPINEVAIKFGCSRGMLQSLQQSSSTFAGMLTIFSRQLGWSAMEVLIAQFQDRLQFGISRDLLDLMKVSLLNGPRARTLYNAGIETLAQLASSDVTFIENVLHKAGPFESKKGRDGESDYDITKRNKMKIVWITGREGLTAKDAAVILVEEARRYLRLELGLVEAVWVKANQNSSKQSSTNVDIEMITSKAEEDLQLSSPKISTPLLNTTPRNKAETVWVKDYQNNIKRSCSQNVGNEMISSKAEEDLQLSSPKIASSPLNTTPNNKVEAVCVKDNQTNIKCNNIQNLYIEMISNKADEVLQLSLPKIASSPLNTTPSKKVDTLEISDQSLFDGSFEQCFDADFSNKHLKEERVLDSNKKRNSDSGLEFDNGSFLENAMITCGNETESIVSNFDGSSSQKANDFIDSSQSVLNSVISFKDISSTNYSRRYSEVGQKKLIDYTVDPSNECTPAKKRKMIEEKSDISVESSRDLTGMDIVDVCKIRNLYSTFCAELQTQKSISLSFACRKYLVSKLLIGNNIVGKNSVDNSFEDARFAHKDVLVEGASFSWGSNIVYYLSFEDEKEITNDEKITMLKHLFSKNMLIIRLFESKEQLKIAKLCCGLDFKGIIEDPKIADWLLDPDCKEKNLQAMALKYAPKVMELLQLTSQCKGVGSVGLDVYSAIDPKIRSSVESIVSWHISHSVTSVLKKQNLKLFSTYRTEMKSLLCITRMELNGIKVDQLQLNHLIDRLKKECENLQNQAFSHAGRRFSFTSPVEVAKILGLYKGKKCSTNKQTLQRHGHPISHLILQWRKLNSTLTKMIYPLIRLVDNDRIYGSCITHTSTGRISMHEPNMQNVPRDFDVDIPILNLKNTISCRSVFVSPENCSFLSADYCQLELRILTAFCEDPTLASIMRTNQDVFKLIASHWRNVDVNEVDDELRQWTKQLCYGIIYGMGFKALAEHLLVTEDEAKDFMNGFKKQYASIETYIQKTICLCRERGYVETYAGRRRYLPNINSENSTLKGQAERQAVNTTIQGSAADITKFAMTEIESRFRSKFRHLKNLPKLILHLHDELLYEVNDKYLLKTARILKQAMEESVKLSIPFPVKLKSGKSWGVMKELII